MPCESGNSTQQSHLDSTHLHGGITDSQIYSPRDMVPLKRSAIYVTRKREIMTVMDWCLNTLSYIVCDYITNLGD